MSHVAMLFEPGREVSAEELCIGAFHPFSSVDWPGKLAASVYTQGCPWRCGYCNTAALQDSKKPGTVTWDEVRSHLARAADEIDGVVFSGGEPTRQIALLPAMQEVRSRGLGVGLQSSGAFPGRLRQTLHYVDWLGLDIKATPDTYVRVTGKPPSGAKAWAALETAVAWGGPLEVRMTVDPLTHTRDIVLEVARRVEELGGPRPVLQEARPKNTTPEYAAALGGCGIDTVLPPSDLATFTVR